MEGYRGRGGLSQTDDQILRQPVRELESMKESDVCLKTQWQPNTLLCTHMHTRTHLVVSVAVTHSTACAQPEGGFLVGEASAVTAAVAAG